MVMQTLKAYEAVISRPESVAYIHSQLPAIRSVGGSLRIAPFQTPGMTLITLRLPTPYQPQEFFPGIPFYPA